MAGELFWDTSGFFAPLNTDDPQHHAARTLAAGRIAGLTTDAVVGESCTLLMARGKSHLVPRFLDITERSRTLQVVHLDEALIADTKNFLRRHLDHAYSFVDCASFVVMTAHRLIDAATTDAHFVEAGFIALLR